MQLSLRRALIFTFSSLALGTALFTTGCAEHRYRTYDPYYSDYHRWNGDEEAYYRRWNAERHYNYVEYNRLNRERQREYWNWRHQQAEHRDRDRDRDHDRDHDRDRR